MDPEGEPVHEHGDHYDNQNQLEGLVGLDPAQKEDGDVDDGSAQEHLGEEQEGLRDHHDHVPDDELHQPIEIAYSNLVSTYAYLVFLLVISSALTCDSPSIIISPP